MSEYNITVEDGSSIKLKTAGKYCDRDIIVTAKGSASDEGKLEQEKIIDITDNGITEIIPDDGKTLSKVTVNVNVEASGEADMAGALASRTITEFYSDNCTEIGDYSFRGCKSLKTLVAPNAKRVGEYALYQCNNLRSITLPSVTTVATNSFRDAQYLEFIDLPKLKAISTNTFYGCRGLKTLILRNSTLVTLNSTSAFTTCYRILGTQNSGFNPNGEKIGFIYVPKALLEDYKVATNWSSDNLVTQLRAIEDYPDITGG